MNDEMIDEIVEIIMRAKHFGTYEDYINEESREYYKQMLQKENR